VARKLTGRVRANSDMGIDDVFRRDPDRIRKPLKMFFWAVRQKRGPEEHESLVIKSHDRLDALGQWFNYHNLAMQSHRYILDALKLPPGHALESQGIECHRPKMEEDIDLNEMAAQSYTDVQSILHGEKEE